MGEKSVVFEASGGLMRSRSALDRIISQFVDINETGHLSRDSRWPMDACAAESACAPYPQPCVSRLGGFGRHLTVECKKKLGRHILAAVQMNKRNR